MQIGITFPQIYLDYYADLPNFAPESYSVTIL